MTIPDERTVPARSRRLNPIDAAVVLVLAVMIPLAYAAYLLFRTPPPRLQSVSPGTIVQGTTPRLLIYGSNLRPFMRVALNDVQAVNFLISSVNGAEADLPPLRPGTYDVVLYDYAQEVSRLPKAVTVVPANPAPSLDMFVGGAFIGVDAGMLGKLTVGTKLPQGDGTQASAGEAEIVQVGAPRDAAVRVRVGDAVIPTRTGAGRLVPATLRVRCFTEANADGTLRCMMPAPQQPVPIVPDAYLSFRLGGLWYAFQVYDAHSDVRPPMATVRARLLVARELAAEVKVDDVDTSVSGYSADAAPRLVRVGSPRPAPVTTASLVNGDSPVFLDATLRLPVEQAVHGWTYRGRPLKTGVAVPFETPAYALTAVVTGFSVEAAAAR